MKQKILIGIVAISIIASFAFMMLTDKVGISMSLFMIAAIFTCVLAHMCEKELLMPVVKFTRT